MEIESEKFQVCKIHLFYNITIVCCMLHFLFWYW